MTKFFLVAGVAALAIAAPAAADKGRGGDKSHKGHSAKIERGGNKGSSAKSERRGGTQRFVAERRKGRDDNRQAFKSDRKTFKAEGKAERKIFAKDRDVAGIRNLGDRDRFADRDRFDGRRS